jgi:hypothetical protein
MHKAIIRIYVNYFLINEICCEKKKDYKLRVEKQKS